LPSARRFCSREIDWNLVFSEATFWGCRRFGHVAFRGRNEFIVVGLGLFNVRAIRSFMFSSLGIRCVGVFSSVKVTVWRRFLDGLSGLGHVA
jgi:hypothetical protein